MLAVCQALADMSPFRETQSKPEVRASDRWIVRLRRRNRTRPFRPFIFFRPFRLFRPFSVSRRGFNLDPLDPLAFECLASTLAARCRVYLRGGAIEGQLMLNTPAFIPPEYIRNGPPEDIKVAKRFISAIPEYNQIFGEDGLIPTKMDVMISSVGPRVAGWLEVGGPLIDKKERKQLLKEGVVGDIYVADLFCKTR